ncbi:MAG: hypothetical protein ACE366_00075 [Bradymonadia bacterium]
MGLVTGLMTLGLCLSVSSAQPRFKPKGLKTGGKVTVKKKGSTGNGPDLRVNRVDVKSWKRGKATLEIYLGKQGGGQVSSDVKITWVEGSKRTVLKTTKARFAGGRDGFMYSASVNIPGDGQKGRLEVVGGDKSKDPSWGNNTKFVSFRGRTDLTFEGRPKVVKKGGGRPNREYILTVANVGKKTSAAGCRVDFKLAENGPERALKRTLPALRPGASTEVKVPYHYVSSSNRKHNTIKAKIVCAQDVGVGNNTHKNRLN